MFPEISSGNQENLEKSLLGAGWKELGMGLQYAVFMT